jgi:hypothetical protein
MMDEMKKVTLKPTTRPENEKQVKISKDESNYLKNSLTIALNQRREELKKNNISDSEKSDDSWSD